MCNFENLIQMCFCVPPAIKALIILIICISIILLVGFIIRCIRNNRARRMEAVFRYFNRSMYGRDCVNMIISLKYLKKRDIRAIFRMARR